MSKVSIAIQDKNVKVTSLPGDKGLVLQPKGCQLEPNNEWDTEPQTAHSQQVGALQTECVWV